MYTLQKLIEMGAIPIDAIELEITDKFISYREYDDKTKQDIDVSDKIPTVENPKWITYSNASRRYHSYNGEDFGIYDLKSPAQFRFLEDSGLKLGFTTKGFPIRFKRTPAQEAYMQSKYRKETSSLQNLTDAQMRAKKELNTQIIKRFEYEQKNKEEHTMEENKNLTWGTEGADPFADIASGLPGGNFDNVETNETPTKKLDINGKGDTTVNTMPSTGGNIADAKLKVAPIVAQIRDFNYKNGTLVGVVTDKDFCFQVTTTKQTKSSESSVRSGGSGQASEATRGDNAQREMVFKYSAPGPVKGLIIDQPVATAFSPQEINTQISNNRELTFDPSNKDKKILVYDKVSAITFIGASYGSKIKQDRRTYGENAKPILGLIIPKAKKDASGEKIGMTNTYVLRQIEKGTPKLISEFSYLPRKMFRLFDLTTIEGGKLTKEQADLLNLSCFKHLYNTRAASATTSASQLIQEHAKRIDVTRDENNNEVYSSIYFEEGKAPVFVQAKPWGKPDKEDVTKIPLKKITYTKDNKPRLQYDIIDSFSPDLSEEDKKLTCFNDPRFETILNVCGRDVLTPAKLLQSAYYVKRKESESAKAKKMANLALIQNSEQALAQIVSQYDEFSSDAAHFEAVNDIFNINN